jgi:DNA-binding NarL/FixJ family response regulator
MSAGGPIRVLVVDDHPVVRQGLRAYLERTAGVTVLADSGDAEEAVALALQMNPDVVIVDLVMPGMDGIELIGALREKRLPAAIVVLTGFDDERRVLRALQLGVQGYVLKDAEPFELVQAIRSAVAGRVYLHPAVAQKVARLIVSRELTGSKSPGTELTRRERQILTFVAQGLKNKEIAVRLSLSEATVKSHMSNILSKLGVADRVQAALWAVKQGMTESEP